MPLHWKPFHENGMVFLLLKSIQKRRKTHREIIPQCALRLRCVNQ